MAKKKCPFCAERVQYEAAVCRFCNRDLPSKKDYSLQAVLLVGVALFLGMIIPFASGSCNYSSPTRSFSPPSQKPWYAGGTLHSSNVEKWLNAEPWDRLATSADFTTAILKRSGKPVDSMDQLLIPAKQIEICISEASLGDPAQGLKVAELAAACAIILGYLINP